MRSVVELDATAIVRSTVHRSLPPRNTGVIKDAHHSRRRTGSDDAPATECAGDRPVPAWSPPAGGSTAADRPARVQASRSLPIGSIISTLTSWPSPRPAPGRHARAERRVPPAPRRPAPARTDRPRAATLSAGDWNAGPSAPSAIRPGRKFIAGEPTKVGDEQVGRPQVDLLRRAELLDLAVLHHRDAVGQRQRLDLVMRDIDHRRVRAAGAGA